MPEADVELAGNEFAILVDSEVRYIYERREKGIQILFRLKLFMVDGGEVDLTLVVVPQGDEDDRARRYNQTLFHKSRKQLPSVIPRNTQRQNDVATRRMTAHLGLGFGFFLTRPNPTLSSHTHHQSRQWLRHPSSRKGAMLFFQR
jgi:hypothetical protein